MFFKKIVADPVEFGGPPAHWLSWSPKEYFDWTKTVQDRLRVVHPMLESIYAVAVENLPSRIYHRLADQLEVEILKGS